MLIPYNIPALSIGEDNIFSFANAENCLVRVHQYNPGHSILTLKVTPPKGQMVYLIFENVEYFEGPISWTGASFYIEQLAIQAELMSRINHNPQLAATWEILLAETSLRLFCVQLQFLQVRIMSSAVSMADSI